MSNVAVEIQITAVCHPGRTIFVVELRTPEDDASVIDGGHCDAVAEALSDAVHRVLTERCPPKRGAMMPTVSREIS